MASKENQYSNLGVLRFEITGRWSVFEFSQFLQNIRGAYLRLNTFHFFVNAIEKENKEGEKPHYFHDVYKHQIEYYWYKRYAPFEDKDIEFLVSTAQRHTTDLYLKSIEYRSPGWIEVLGNWNPLKLILDFVSQWRKENTEREKNKDQAQIEKSKINADREVEELRIRFDFAKELIESGKPLRDAGTPEQYERLLHFVLTPTEETLRNVAKDNRITDVKLLSPESDSSSTSSGSDSSPKT